MFSVMEAKTLNCPMCGATASTDATKCLHCGARLATIACPACFGMIFRGAKFCSHCGAKVDRQEVADDSVHACPGCRVNMKAIVVGKTDLRECPKCEGIWADADSLQQICADREQQAALLGVAVPVPTPTDAPLEKITYRPCPVCHQLMHRVNFARCSHVVVDVCKAHGTWFDKDELRRIVEFIQAGGFDKVRAMERAELDRQRAALEATRVASGWDNRSAYDSCYDSREPALFSAASVLRSFFH
jgi:Zn-finger nucleic acid-binding protein/ribosomal protein L40E